MARTFSRSDWRRVPFFVGCGFVGGLMGGTVGNAISGHPAWGRTTIMLAVMVAVAFGVAEAFRVALRRRRRARDG